MIRFPPRMQVKVLACVISRAVFGFFPLPKEEVFTESLSERKPHQVFSGSACFVHAIQFSATYGLADVRDRVFDLLDFIGVSILLVRFSGNFPMFSSVIYWSFGQYNLVTVETQDKA